jgi:hypothetical protein
MVRGERKVLLERERCALGVALAAMARRSAERDNLPNVWTLDDRRNGHWQPPPALGEIFERGHVTFTASHLAARCIVKQEMFTAALTK